MPRLLPPVLLILAIALMLALHQFLPGPHLISSPLLRWTGFVVLGVGLGVAWWHARLFRRTGTNIHTFGEPGVLVTAGLFRFTRNPMYLGFVLVLVGLAAILGAATPAAVAVGYALVTDRVYIRFEEAAMQRRFGSAYTAYCGRVRRWL